MYAWIWRKLPFGLYGKLTGSILIAGTMVALLWFFVFPWVEPILPFDDVQVGDPGGDYTDVDPGFDLVPTPTGDLSDHDIPYDVDEPTPSPS